MLNKETLIRAVITFVLCFGILMAWQYFMPTPQAPAPVSTPVTTENNTPQAAESTILPPSVEYVPVAEPFVIDTENFDIAFDPDSGDVLYAALHGYDNSLGEVPKFISRTGTPYAAFVAGIKSGFTADVTHINDGVTVSFRAVSDQIEVLKTYTITDGYLIPMTLEVKNLTGVGLSVPVTATVGPGLGTGFGENKYVFEGPIIHQHKKTEKKKETDIKKNLVLDNPLWGGYTSKYFLFSVFAQGFKQAEIVKASSSAMVVLSQELSIPAGETAAVQDLAIFVGPKGHDLLASYGVELQKSIDYGMFFFLSIPMIKVMDFAYRFVHNYGVAIIILTILVKLITLPLTLKSMLSMQNMAKVQPEMKLLREKYKDQPEKMNAATMELYKKYNVNPMAGCLPMVIQLPIFFALYKSLLVTIQLKGAPFFGWIMDLSEKDPYFITPIIMGATMFIQQKMTPSAADPMQQKIMLLMPVVFTFLFVNFPSGLVIYWLTNNVLSIAQQYVINKKMRKNEPMVEAPAAAEKRKKKKPFEK